MDQREARRRARVLVFHLINSQLGQGWELGHYTDDGSEEEVLLLERELSEVGMILTRVLPEGFELPHENELYFRPGTSS
jgi:hypothetical protein